jgi:hypothetical protein
LTISKAHLGVPAQVRAVGWPAPRVAAGRADGLRQAEGELTAVGGRLGVVDRVARSRDV